MALNVLQVSFFADPQRREPERLLADWHSLGDIAESVAAAGNRVTVIQASHVPGQIRRHDVEYHFLPPPADASLAETPAFRERFTASGAQVVHVHGLGFGRDVLALRAFAPRTPILLQDHADRPPRIWRRRAWKRGVAAADGVSFCAHGLTGEFHRPGLLPASLRVFEIPESTSRFVPGDRELARSATGVHGNPCLLWVGHLDGNKDPLTVLEGMRLAFDRLPRLMLWCCFGTAPLLQEVRERIASDTRLQQCVRLIGQVPHSRVEQLMRAADVFVLGSHREGSSFSLIEALANYGKAHGMQVNAEQASKFSDLELVNLLGVSLPFHPAEKQALLEAATLKDRENMLIDLLKLGAGPAASELEVSQRTLN